MTTDINLNTTMSSMSTDDEAIPVCVLPLFVIKLTKFPIAILLVTATLILIPCRRRLCKQHNIIPYNHVLSDLSGVMAFAVFEGTTEFPVRYLRLQIV